MPKAPRKRRTPAKVSTRSSKLKATQTDDFRRYIETLLAGRDSLPAEGWVNADSVGRYFSISYVTLWRWIKYRGFPPGNTDLGVRRWDVRDVRAFADNMRARTNGQGAA